jgi:hypothetical protein
MFLPEIEILEICLSIQDFKWKSGGVDSPHLKHSTVYSCAEGVNGRSLNFEYNLDDRRAESSDNLKSSRQILLY